MKAETLQDVKKELINAGFTVFYTLDNNKKETYFSYMLDNKFGYVQAEYDGCYHIGSIYKPSKQAGTGCNYKDRIVNPTIGDFKGALNYHFTNLSPVFYNDIQDYLSNNWSVFKLIVEDKQGVKTSLDYLDGYYIFKSDTYAPVISKNHMHLFKNYYKKRSDKYKVIFQISSKKLEAINHNINLFIDGSIMQGFKNRILNQ